MRVASTAFLVTIFIFIIGFGIFFYAQQAAACDKAHGVLVRSAFGYSCAAAAHGN